MADEQKIPTVTHVIVNAVMVCSCEAHIVLVLNVIGGTVECASCKRTWVAPVMEYSLDTEAEPGMGIVRIKCDIEQVVPSLIDTDLTKLRGITGGKLGS